MIREECGPLEANQSNQRDFEDIDENEMAFEGIRGQFEFTATSDYFESSATTSN